jgi:hypothetical protein
MMSDKKGETLCVCGQKGTKRCSRCGARFYCSVSCQKQDWPAHKLVCTSATPAPRESLEKTSAHFQQKLARGERRGFAWPYPKNLCELERSLVKVLLAETQRKDDTEAYKRHLRSYWRRKLLMFDREAQASKESFYRHVRTGFEAGALLDATTSGIKLDGGTFCFLDILFYRDSEVLPEVTFWKIISEGDGAKPEAGVGRLIAFTTADVLFDHRAAKTPIGVLSLLPATTRAEEVLGWETGRVVVHCHYIDGYTPPPLAECARMVVHGKEFIDFLRHELGLQV